jgi:histidine triad (HIT) family protein
MDCIFCQIVSGKIPSFKIYEDDQFLGFLDIKPLNSGHSLLIPKAHYRWVYDVPESGHYWEIAKTIALHTRKVLGCDYISFLTMGNEVPHAHIHIIPRFFNDGHRHGIDTNLRTNADFGQLKQLATQLKLG